MELSQIVNKEANPVLISQVQRDIIARSIDNVIGTIGTENIVTFLPMWEAEGSTQISDLLTNDLKFDVVNATLGGDGLLGGSVNIGANNQYLQQAPVTKNQYGTTDLPLNGAALKAATRIKAICTRGSLIALQLKRVGNLASAKMQLTICADNSGVPGTVIATSSPVDCSNVLTSACQIGFLFSPVGLQKSAQYWLVLQYLDSTGVDTSNYISWQYEQTVNSYGEARSLYNGSSWTTTSGDNHTFALYNDDMVFYTNDWSIVCGYNMSTPGTLLTQLTQAGGSLLRLTAEYGLIDFLTTTSPSQPDPWMYRIPLNNWNVLAGTFSYAKATGKTNLYLNAGGSGSPSSANGTANTAQSALLQPFVIGAQINADGSISANMVGNIGPFIITRNELSQAQIGTIVRNLFALRNYKGTL